MRDIVDDYWDSLSDEEKAKWVDSLSDEEIAKQAAEARAKLDAIHTHLYGGEPPALLATMPGTVSAVAQPQYIVPMNIGPDGPPMQPMTIFLDGLIKRPMSDDLNLGCAWCEVSVRVPFPRDNRATDWMHASVPEGWRLIGPSDDSRYMCPACVKTEIPE